MLCSGHSSLVGNEVGAVLLFCTTSNYEAQSPHRHIWLDGDTVVLFQLCCLISSSSSSSSSSNTSSGVVVVVVVVGVVVVVAVGVVVLVVVD